MNTKKFQFWNVVGLLMLILLPVSCTVYDNPVSLIEPEEKKVETDGFFTPEINKLIDENQKLVEANGYAELVIPASMFDHKAFKIPANEAGDMDYVVNAGYKTYVYGGTVRDAVCGVPSNDVDFTSDATPEQLEQIVPNTKLFVAPNGYKVAQAWHGEERTDMTTMRAIYYFLRGEEGIPESKYPTDGTINVYSKELWEDSYSRDLTINSIYYDYQTGNLITYHGGLYDLREGIIRPGFNPDCMYSNIPNNLLRAVRFAARFNFRIDDATDKAIRKNLPNVDKLGGSGIAYDLTSGFHDGCMQRTYAMYKEYGFVHRFFTTLNSLENDNKFNSYIRKVYHYLDEKKCKDTQVNMAALFMPALKEAMGTNEWTEENIASTWNNLETETKQKDFFEISESNKTAIFKIWYLVNQLSSATPQAGIENEANYAQAKLLYDAINDGKTKAPNFFSEEINKLIDENYKEVIANGYSELIIPAKLYDQSIYDISADHKSAMDYMAKAGHKTYVNGGAVRDGILGTQIHDVDFSTDATPEQMVAIVPNSKEVQAGPVKIAQAHHSSGDVTDMVPIRGIDKRLEGKPGVPESPYMGQTYSQNLIDDTYSRDLTINSVYYDYQTGDLIDYHGGLHDLREGIIRTVYDANLMFPINASAIIRTVRFAARYGYEIDADTKKAIQDNLHYCDSLRPSLVNYYVMKGFNDGCSTRTYQYYLDNGILDRYMLILKDYLHNEDYQAWLFPVLEYLDMVKNKWTAPVNAAFYLDPMKKELASKEPTLENITAAWDKLETESGQKKHFETDDYSKVRTETLTVWYLYFKMIDPATRNNQALVKEIKGNDNYSKAKDLLYGIAQSEPTLLYLTNFWK